MPQGNKSVSELYHPYLGKSYGNILDEYDSSTYNAKLYIINPGTEAGEAAQSSETARQNTGAPGNSKSALTADPSQTVVLAQTGVTAGNTIESITIPTVQAIAGQPVNITIKQPNRADFLDQIALARSFLGLEGREDLVVYLELSFLGFEAEDDFFVSLGGGTDTGGAIADIIGPYRWKLKVTNLSATMDSTGSTYELVAVPQGEEAFTNRRYRLNQNITAKGKTITEMVKSVEDGLNKFMQSNNDKQAKDEIEFDLSGLLTSASSNPDPNKVLIEDENLILPDVNTGDVAKAPLNRADADADTTSEERVDESQQTQTDNEELNDEEVTNIINFQPGESIDDIMHKILAMCPEAVSRFTRKQNITEIDDLECRKDQAFVQKLKINAGLEELGFDKRTNMSAYKIIYRPILMRTADSTQFAIPEENADLTSEEVQSRFDQIVGSGNCRKGYRYLYTGMNDQILDLDITFDATAAVVMAPRRGLVGTPDAAASKEKTDNVEKTEDTSASGLFDSLKKGFEALAKDTISGLFSGDFSGIQGGLDSFVATLEQEGFSQTQLDQLEQAIANQAEGELQSFLETIDSNTLRNLATNLIIQPRNPTTGIPPEYSPEQSGYQYSEDFFALNNTTGIDVGDLEQLGFLTGFEDAFKSQIEQPKKETDTPIVNPVEGVTVDLNAPHVNTVFGQMVSQAAGKPFLMNLDMTIRGDPWYLGYDTSQGQNNNTQAAQSSSDSFESSQPEYGYFGGDANYFFLEIAAPRPWDFDYRDEDSPLNSGYWMNTNTSYTYSGLYKIQGVVHNFANGLYTVNLTAVKESSVYASMLEKKQPNDSVEE